MASLLNFHSDDGLLLITEYSKGFVSIQSGRLVHAIKSDKVTLSAVGHDHFLNFAGVSLSLCYWELKELIAINFGFPIDFTEMED